jgi:hypothetical protein
MTDEHGHAEEPSQGLFLGGLGLALLAVMVLFAATVLIAAATNPAVL